MNGLKRALLLVADILVGAAVIFYTLLDELLFPIFRPLIRWLSGLRLFERLGALIQMLPPYAMLVVLAVPFVVIEPLKVFALYWLALGHVVQGGALMIISHVGSILILERLYHTGHAQLMRIGWFKAVMDRVIGVRDTILGWVKTTAAWRWARGVAASIRAAVQRMLRSAR